jgi:putative inorganic carbon (HCO3(-)) transporter
MSIAAVGTDGKAAAPWLIGLECFGTAVAAPFLVFPTLFPLVAAIVLCLLAALWLVHWFVRREPWPVTPFNGVLLLFAVTIPVGIWASAVQELTLPKAAGLVLGLATFRAVALTVRDRRSLGIALFALCLLGVAITAVGAAGVEWATKVPILESLGGRIPRLLTSLPDLRAAAINPNQLAGALALYLPFGTALVIGGRRWIGSLALYVACAVFLLLVIGMLLLTQSRGGWIGGAAGVLALVTLWGLGDRHRWMRALGVVLPLLILFVALGALLYTGTERVGEVLYGVTQDSVETAAGTITIQGRVEIWSRALYAIQDFPFTGCGLGTFRQVVQVLYPLFLVGPDRDIAHAHNIFLQVALDLGLPGLSAYLAILGIAGATCWRCARRGGPLVRSVALGLMAGLVGLHVYGLADALALGSKPGVAFWFALGLIAALPRVAQQEGGRARETHGARVTRHASRLTHYVRSHPWPVAAVAFLTLALLLAGSYLGYRLLRSEAGLPGGSSIRLPLYPAAQGIEVRSESPAADGGWVGQLEVATFTTTHPITEVVAFYTSALTEGGWEANTEAGDAESWGGIYTQNEGHSVCLLNAFVIEGEVWCSIVCGDKAEPVDLPGLHEE